MNEKIVDKSIYIVYTIFIEEMMIWKQNFKSGVIQLE